MKPPEGSTQNSRSAARVVSQYDLLVLQRLDLRELGKDLSLPRPELADEPIDAVRAILGEVQERGDAALIDFTERFDGVRLDAVRVPPEDLQAALDQIAPDLREALTAAAEAITHYHQQQLSEPYDYERDGISVRGWSQPVQRAGCYVPGGLAIYPSTVLMTAVIARVAGVKEVVVCVPPGANGEVPAETLAAAQIAGVDEVYAIGGAQAIAALAYGTESIAPVDVIVGPGNRYVAVAKREVAGRVGVPSAFAGPSEIVVVADDSTPPELAAIDLAVQAEHGPNGLCWLITTSEKTADLVGEALQRIVAEQPRKDEITNNLKTAGFVALVRDAEQTAQVINEIAPEHLQLMTEKPEDLLALIHNAGAIFVGLNAPASIGDYIAGPSHVLPTAGTARFSGALEIGDFCKPMHVISVSDQGLAQVSDHVRAIAKAEGLDAHARSVEMRIENP